MSAIRGCSEAVLLLGFFLLFCFKFSVKNCTKNEAHFKRSNIIPLNSYSKSLNVADVLTSNTHFFVSAEESAAVEVLADIMSKKVLVFFSQYTTS